MFDARSSLRTRLLLDLVRYATRRKIRNEIKQVSLTLTWMVLGACGLGRWARFAPEAYHRSKMRLCTLKMSLPLCASYAVTEDFHGFLQK